MAHVSDFDHRRLEAVIFPDHCVVETHQLSDAARGLRRVPVTKVWRTERTLGRGGFGEVYLQSQESDKDQKRALKVIPTKGLKWSFTDCQRELTAMIEFTKPKYRDAAVFVDFLGWFQNDDAMFLAMEYMPFSDLEQNLQDIENSSLNNKSPLCEEEVQEISRQILEGLKIMHAEGFAHRDLKPQNIFVVQKQPQWWVKLGDFGLSKKRTEGTAYRTHAGTQQYMAPELFYYVQELDTETSEYTSAIDLWSLGCIIYRIVTGAVPFPDLRSLRDYTRNPSKFSSSIPPTMEEAGRFVQDLLMPHPAKRPLAAAALGSIWITMNSKPVSLVDDVGIDFTTLQISQGQNNYNTASHKGLQSFYSTSVTNDGTAVIFNDKAASELLLVSKSDARSGSTEALHVSKLRDESEALTARMIPSEDVKYPNSEPRPETPLYEISSQQSSDMMITPGKGSAPSSQEQTRTPPMLNDNLIDSVLPNVATGVQIQTSLAIEPSSDFHEIEIPAPQRSSDVPDGIHDRSEEFTLLNLDQSGGALPPGWKIRFSKAGAKYFYDTATHTSTWGDPRLPVDDSGGELPQGWEIRFSRAKNEKYYYNRATKTSTWKDPRLPLHDSGGKLPQGWEIQYSSANEKYYYDTATKTSTWSDPRTSNYDSDGELPEGWEIRYSSAKKKYFYNRTTKTSTWKDPRLPNYDSDGELPKGWEIRYSSAKKKYFHDTATKTSTWKDPRRTLYDSGGNLPKGWEFRFSKANKMYFYNTTTNTTTWKDPRLPLDESKGKFP